MEETRLKKLEELRKKGINPYPYRYGDVPSIGNIRKKWEKDPEGEKVVIKGKVKRVSKIDEGFMLRVADESNLEILVFTKESFDQGKEYTIEGNLVRKEGKLSLIDAKPSSEDPLSIAEIKKPYDFDPEGERVKIAGRLVTLRQMGKALFGHIQDIEGKIQIYLKEDIAGKENYKVFNEYVDVGDILGVEGTLFRTNTGELTVNVEKFYLLSKCLHPLPEKWHGIKDVEVRYRHRYLDLIANEYARKTFLMRSKLIKTIRHFFDKEGFIEVETPILQSVASGATAKPFVTYHNYLETDLFLRIAPELYLKRLIVGGFPKVYEIGKNFRNEGVDTTHNPEFTMLEFYVAYWDYEDLMVFTERLLEYIAKELTGSTEIIYQGEKINFSPPFKRISYFEILEEKTGKDKDFFLKHESELRRWAKKMELQKVDDMTHTKMIDKIFEHFVEHELIQPTFITDFPKLLSPLAKTHREDKDLVERFELFIARKEVINAYTELNDPLEQKERFLEQLKEKEMGDEEAMEMDEDFIRALEYGMPPTAGEGIGIDRLAMIFADTPSIREVIIFPALRKVKDEVNI